VAFEVFLKLGAIDGDSVDKAHLKWIAVDTFSWGLERESGTGGFPAPSASVARPVNFEAQPGMASPKIAASCLTGAKIPEADVDVVDTASRAIFLKYRFMDVVVSSFEESLNAVPKVQVTAFTLGFAKVSITEQGLGPNGLPGPAVSATLDFLKQTAT
jgi:type VI protein secretion system component Hcp